jgi:lysophospholipase L1-like esterase
MKKLIASITMFALLLALLLAGCSLDVPSDPTGQVNDPGPGDASTPYVAIGNSLTAGFMDSGLMQAGQANSYPMIVATQMGLNTDTFTQPWVASPGIGTTGLSAGQVAGVLYYNGMDVAPLDSTPEAQVAGLLLAVAQPTQYHNLGVPGAFSFDLLNAYSAATSYGVNLGKPNTFFEFINRAGPLVNLFKNSEVPAAPPAPGYQTGSQFYQVIAKGPALVTAWIGGNDFLFGATSGEPMGHPAITPAGDINAPVPGTFAYNYSGFLHSLAGGLLKRNGFPPTIVGATLPLVRNIPFFLDRATFEAVFGPTYGPFTYEEATAEYILFTNFLAAGLPATLPQAMTLDTAERHYLDTDVIGAYNTIVQTVVAQVDGNPAIPADAGFVDFNTALDDLRISNPEALRHFLFLRIIHPTDTIAETAARTYFSLDGVHPNNHGYVFTANSFLAVINTLTGSAYSPVPPEAVVYDPTYGVTVKATGGIPKISPEVAEAMRMSFR